MRIGWCGLAVLVVPGLAMAQLPTRKYLPVGLAVDAALSAIEKCEEFGQHVAVAVVEPSGQALVVMRYDRARIQSLETARTWAQRGATQPPATAQAAPTRPATAPDADLDEPRRRAQEDTRRRLEEQRQRASLAQRRMQGLPIEAGDILVAQIAVAGAAEAENDLVCAKAGIDRIRAHLK